MSNHMSYKTMGIIIIIHPCPDLNTSLLGKRPPWCGRPVAQLYVWYSHYQCAILYMYMAMSSVDTLRPRQNGWHFETTFSNAFSWMKMYKLWFKNSLKFVPKGPINNIPSLVQIMAWPWRQPGDKLLLSEPMMGSLLTHICITRLQYITLRPLK